MNEDPLVFLIQVLVQKGKRELAKRVIDLFAKYVASELQSYAVANCYFIYGDHDKAIKHGENALVMTDSPQKKYILRSNLAQVYFAANKFKQALRYINVNERLMPSKEMAVLRLQIENKMELESGISSTGVWSDTLADNFHEYSVELGLWLVKNLNKTKHVNDLGCGNGSYLKDLKNAGYKKLQGYDGKVPSGKVFENILQQDLTHPFEVQTKGQVLCLEVGEHIPKEFEQVFLDNICNACDSTLILSWAIIGQTGGGHVNCQENDYVIAEAEKRGFEFKPEETKSIRETIGATCYWFKNTLMVFEKKKTVKKKKV
jgi:2-polyprenyl-3-methyl-5-hydroxy-6-metoxy-1,4-benzoquinol methylase